MSGKIRNFVAYKTNGTNAKKNETCKLEKRI